MAELQALAQRLVAALHRHTPSDGRTAHVKLEAGVKQEAAAQLRRFGKTVDTALDVDDEYAPTYVAGAQMGSLVKDEPPHQQRMNAGVDGAAAAQGGGGGGRREPRKRPPR